MIDGYVALHARLHPSWPAVILPKTQISFAKFDEDIDRACWELDGIEVGRDEAVCVALHHPYLHWLGIMALARLGIASAQSNAVGCRLRLGDGRTPGSSPELTWDKKRVARILHGAPCKWHNERCDQLGTGRVFQTSGTTGRPKRIPSSWRVLDHSAGMFAARGLPGPWAAASGVASALGFTSLLSCWFMGYPAIMGAHGPLDGAYLTRLRPRVISLVPDQLKKLVDSLPPDFQPAPLRIISSGGAIPAALARKVRLALTSDVQSLYAATEVGTIGVAELPQLEAGHGAAGFLAPNVEIEILNEEGRPVPFGEPGRLRARSYRLPDAYLNDEELSASVLKDGWFDTGDLVRLNLDGMLTVEGRADDLMNIAGHKVLPGWIEEAALGCEGVQDAGAFSVPDEAGLERCVVALVIGPEFSEAALFRALNQQLRWLVSIGWIAVDRMPRNQMGKIERLKLRKLAAALKPGTATVGGIPALDPEGAPLDLSLEDIVAQ